MSQAGGARITVLGAGSWGTALAKHFGDAGMRVRLWAHRPQHAATIDATRENRQYLAGYPLPDTISVVSNFEEAFEGKF